MTENTNKLVTHRIISKTTSVFKRAETNPILYPDPLHAWESFKVYNPGAVYYENQYHLFYRAVGHGSDWYSSIGYAVSDNGVNFVRYPEPVLTRDNKDTELRGLEDPRIVRIGDKFVMSYAAYDGQNVRLHTAFSDDLQTWSKNPPALPGFYFTREGGEYSRFTKDGWTHTYTPKGTDERSKSGAVFSEEIDGKYWMVFGEYRIWLATSSDLVTWEHMPGPFLGPREGDFFDNVFVEVGPPPIKTDKGWLVLYHGINKQFAYQLGYVLLDLEDPTKIIYRSENPVFGPGALYEYYGFVDVLPGGFKQMADMSPEELRRLLPKYEKEGLMPKVAFCPAAVLVGDEVRIFYGASDTYVCTAVAKLEDILSVR